MKRRVIKRRFAMQIFGMEIHTGVEHLPGMLSNQSQKTGFMSLAATL